MVTGQKVKSVYEVTKLYQPILYSTTCTSYRHCSRQLYRYAETEKQPKIVSRKEWIEHLQSKGCLSWWSQAAELANSDSWDVVLDAFVQSHAAELTEYHPDVIIDSDTKREFELLFQRSKIDLELKYLRSKNIHKRVPNAYFSDLLLSVEPEYESICIQSEYANEMVKSGLIDTIMLDGSFVKIFGMDNKVLYSHEISYSGLIKSGTLDRSSKIIPLGVIWTNGKQSDNYTRICKSVIDKHTEWAKNMECIRHLSTDMEWSLFTDFKVNWWPNASNDFCFFHIFQKWIGRVNVKYFSDFDV